MTAAPAPMPYKLTPAQVAILREIIASDPTAQAPRIRAAFRARTGRDVTPRAIYNHRGRIAEARRTAPPGCFPGLPRDQADALAWIVANRPDLTDIQCVALLAAEVGRIEP